jgi:hypothetical protein
MAKTSEKAVKAKTSEKAVKTPPLSEMTLAELASLHANLARQRDELATLYRVVAHEIESRSAVAGASDQSLREVWAKLSDTERESLVQQAQHIQRIVPSGIEPGETFGKV